MKIYTIVLLKVLLGISAASVVSLSYADGGLIMLEKSQESRQTLKCSGHEKS